MRSLDDDLEARAKDLDTSADGLKWMEISFWILSILALAVLIGCVIAGAVWWVSTISGSLFGYTLGSVTTARRRRRKAFQESARLRGLLNKRRAICN
jgi:Flp pilus assembly protein TadB